MVRRVAVSWSLWPVQETPVHFCVVGGRTGRETLYRRVLPNSTYPVAGLGGGDVAEALGCLHSLRMRYTFRRGCPSSTRRSMYLVDRPLVPLQVMRQGNFA